MKIVLFIPATQQISKVTCNGPRATNPPDQSGVGYARECDPSLVSLLLLIGAPGVRGLVVFFWCGIGRLGFKV